MQFIENIQKHLENKKIINWETLPLITRKKTTKNISKQFYKNYGSSILHDSIEYNIMEIRNFDEEEDVNDKIY